MDNTSPVTGATSYGIGLQSSDETQNKTYLWMDTCNNYVFVLLVNVILASDMFPSHLGIVIDIVQG